MLTSEDKKIFQVYLKLRKNLERVKRNGALEKKVSFTDNNNPLFCRLYNVHYANNFVFGFVGTEKKSEHDL